jgi:8-oxo-dGTP pyrophosphatase MutT (NUDIX family)
MKHYGRQSSITLVFDHEGRVLVLRRGPTDPWKPGHWNFPGGRADPEDASAVHTAARELAEEAGICLPTSAFNWAFSFRNPGLVNVFWVKLPGRPQVRSYDGEHDAYVWTFLQQIPQPTLHNVRYVVEQVTGRMWNLAPHG